MVSTHGEGGGTKRERGGGGEKFYPEVKFFPNEKGKQKNVSHADGGQTEFWGSFYTVA